MKNLGRRLVLLPILCYGNLGDEHGKPTACQKTPAAELFRLQHTRCLLYYILHPQSKNTLSRIVGAIHESPKTQLTDCGMIVNSVIQTLPSHLCVTIDRYVIMPNHVHLILVITEEDAIQAIRKSPPHSRSIISKAVGYIKMNASKEIRGIYGDIPVWQRGFHDHVIRNWDDYEMITIYIHENPLRWELDMLYSEDRP